MVGERKAFSSRISYQDAANKAAQAGYTQIAGQMVNSHGQFVVFARQAQPMDIRSKIW